MSGDILIPENRSQDNKVPESNEDFLNLNFNGSTRKIISVSGSRRYLPVDRRRTWSPFSLEQVIFESQNIDMHAKYCRSDDKIDKITHYPPVIAPISGKLHMVCKISSALRYFPVKNSNRTLNQIQVL